MEKGGVDSRVPLGLEGFRGILLSEMEDNIPKYVFITVTTNLKRSFKFGVFTSGSVNQKEAQKER